MKGENKLVSCTDYVIELGNHKTLLLSNEQKMINYANFLKQPLTLGMFIPCDLDGNVLEEPIRERYKALGKFTELQAETNYKWDSEQYQEAKDRILFESYNEYDFKGLKHTLDFENGTIEDLTDLGLTLTQNAIKNI